MGVNPGNGANSVRVHSHPFPTRSCTPKALAPAGCTPTGEGSHDLKSKFPLDALGASSPHGYVRSRAPSGVPDAAGGNGASVGSLRPSHFAYAVASAWLTYTGHSCGKRISSNIVR